jgi:hypothetical protein
LLKSSTSGVVGIGWSRSVAFAAFQTASGDTHPIHYDVEFCRAHGLRGMLAHGFFNRVRLITTQRNFRFVALPPDRFKKGCRASVFAGSTSNNQREFHNVCQR